jgi:hypothetical protein
VIDRDQIRARVILELRETLQHQQRGRLRYRHKPSGVHRIITDLGEEGVDLTSMRGPWQVVAVALRRRGRGSQSEIPGVERGTTRVFAASAEGAVELAGLLNWCEVAEQDLEPSEPTSPVDPAKRPPPPRRR